MIAGTCKRCKLPVRTTLDGEGYLVSCGNTDCIFLCKEQPKSAPPEPFPSCLAEGFGDPLTLLNSRDWLQGAIESKGGKVTGGGVGGGQADLDFTLEGCKFNVSLKPIIRPLAGRSDG